MKMEQRCRTMGDKKAVSIVVSAILLIAITVVAAMILYVYAINMVGSLTTSDQPMQMLQERIGPASYNWNTPSTLIVYMENLGSSPVQIATVFINGVPRTITSSTCSMQIPVGQMCGFTVNVGFTPVNMEAYQIEFVTQVGAVFVFEAVCGGTG